MSKGYRNKAIGVRDGIDSLGLYSLMKYDEIMNLHSVAAKNDKGEMVLVEVDRSYTVYYVSEGKRYVKGFYTLADDVQREIKELLCE